MLSLLPFVNYGIATMWTKIYHVRILCLHKAKQEQTKKDKSWKVFKLWKLYSLLSKYFSFNYQVGDLDINYINIEGITENTCLESMGSTLGPQSSKPILPTETSAGTYPPNENTEVTSHTEAQPSLMSPSSSYASSLNLSFGLHGFEKEQSHLKKRR